MRPSALWLAAAIVLLLVLAGAIVRIAWVCDDGLITLRVVENICTGHGPVWNPGERVQVSVHPLWTWCLAAARALTGECYFTAIAVGALLSLIAAAIMMRAAGTAAAATATVALLLGSRAYLEYSTAGLETPLLCLVLALLVRTQGRALPPWQHLHRVAWLTGIAAVARFDSLVLLLPSLAFAAWRALREGGLGRGRWLRVASHVLLGLSPLIAWELFAVVYYGSPFPVIAYAKLLCHGIPDLVLAQQGLHYLVYVWFHNPVAAVTTVAGCALGSFVPSLRSRALAIGVLLYTLYVVKVGGDFMAGRFAIPGFVVAAGIVARALARARGFLVGLVVIAAGVLTCAYGRPPWTLPRTGPYPPNELYHGIHNEWLYYRGTLALLSEHRHVPAPGANSVILRNLGFDRRWFRVEGGVGLVGFESGELIHVVDPWLLDPLMMRLPLADPEVWHIGHFVRRVPTGYLETLAFGGNHFHHPGLARYYDALRLVVRAPLFAPERWRAMWGLWTGAYDRDLADYVAEEYRTPPRIVVPAETIATHVPAGPRGVGLQWSDVPQARVIYGGGVEVRLAAPTESHRVQVQVMGGTDLRYRLQPCRDGAALGCAVIDASERYFGLGLGDYTVDLPPDIGPFDAIRIDAPDAPCEAIPAIGYLCVLE